ncbi:hypothetical protein ACU8WE_26230 [Pseudomonas parakoreensis]
MNKQNCVEPDFAAESFKFQKHAAELGLCLDRLPGGFYVEQKTQSAWASWIRQAAMDGYTELKRAAEACKDSLSLRYMESHGELYIRNDHGIVFDVHRNRSFPEIMETNKAYADLVLAARPSAVLSLIAEIEALKGPHDWLAEDLIKELVDNAQSFQENACEEGEDPFVVVLLAAASRIRRQEANIEQMKAGFKNFHRSLCERFGYFHDEADWQRDQLSLEEHIATQFSHVSAENAALRGQVEALQRGAGQLQEENEALRKERDKLAEDKQGLLEDFAGCL